MNNKSAISLVIISTFLQTIIYSLLLLLAYYFWSAPNASFIIGTAFPIVIPGFFIVVLIQNLIALSSKKTHVWATAIFIYALMIIPFMYPDWFSLLLILISTFIMYIPLLLKKQFLKHLKKVVDVV